MTDATAPVSPPDREAAAGMWAAYAEAHPQAA
ncbi:ASCH domain-containing protein, partial [Clavibacter michiganensis subsp. insidiosus]